MQKRPIIVLGSILIAVFRTVGFVTLSIRKQAASAVRDPRQEPPIVRSAGGGSSAGRDNRAAGLDGYHAVIEATVQRTRPVILTALAAVGK